MTSETFEKRRRLLAILIGLGGYRFLPVEGSDADSPEPEPRSELFHGVEVGIEQIENMVAAYQSVYGEIRNPQEIEQKVFSSGWLSEDPEAIWRHIKSRIKDDFEANRTILVNGWLLSVVEVQVWCLYYFASSYD